MVCLAGHGGKEKFKELQMFFSFTTAKLDGLFDKKLPNFPVRYCPYADSTTAPLLQAVSAFQKKAKGEL